MKTATAAGQAQNLGREYHQPGSCYPRHHSHCPQANTIENSQENKIVTKLPSEAGAGQVLQSWKTASSKLMFSCKLNITIV